MSGSARGMEMKRNRAEHAASSGALPGIPPAKFQAPRARKAAAPAAEKRRDGCVVRGGDDERMATAAAAAAAAESSPLAGEAATMADAAWEVGSEAELGGGWWWWLRPGVEEEKLLGWFPFSAEDFVCLEERGEGETEEEDHDIWQLQHIHEIPNSTNNP